MQNENDEFGSKRHRIPTGQSLGVWCEHNNDSRQTHSAATHIDDDDVRCGQSAETVTTSMKERNVGGSTSAALLRRSSRLPRPTASASNGVVASRRDDESLGARRTRRSLPTLQGVVINSPTYSATRPTVCLVASIISKCRIPAPVTMTRRISSWTDGCVSQTAASPSRAIANRTSHTMSGYVSRTGRLSPNFGDQSTTDVPPRSCSTAGNDDSAPTTMHELKHNVRFSPDAEKLCEEHVCCGCAGKGLVSSHLLCIRSTMKSAEWEREVEMKSRRRRSPRPPRVYRFHVSDGHRLAVAQAAVEAGFELLPSEPRCFDVATDDVVPETTSGSVRSHKHSNKQVDDEPQLVKATRRSVVIDNELPDSQLSEVAAETGSKQTFRLPSQRNDQQPETTVARLSTSSRIPRLNRNNPGMCSSREIIRYISCLLGNSDTKDGTKSPQRTCDQQLASVSYTISDGLQTKATETAEKSIALELRKVANKCSTDSRLSEVKEKKISEEKSAVIRADKRSAANSSTSSHMHHEATRRKQLTRGVMDRQRGKRKRHVSVESSETNSEPARFVSMCGHDVPVNFGFAVHDEIRRRSPLSVTFACKNDGCRCHRSAGGRELITWPSCHDVAVVAPPPSPQRQECSVRAEISTKNSPKRFSGEVKDLLVSEFQSVDQTTKSAVKVEEPSHMETHPTTVAKAHLIESSDILYASKDLVVTEQSTLNCDSTIVSNGEQNRQQSYSAGRGQTATPSFLIGIAPPRSLDNYHRKRRVSRADDSHSVEPTPSFISCSASEKDFSHTPARQKNTADKQSTRPNTSTAKGVASTTGNSRSKSSSTSSRSKNHLSSFRDRSSEQNSDGNKSVSKLKTSTCKYICQRKSESQRETTSTSEHAKISTQKDKIRRSSKGNQTKNTGARYRHREKESDKFDKRTGEVLVNNTSHKCTIDLGLAQKSGHSSCINPKKRASDGRMNIPRTKYMFRQLNQASDSGISPFAVKNTLPTDSKHANEIDDDQTPFVPLVCSSFRSDEISNELPKPVSFFISYPSASRSSSRTATKTSRIPRPQTSNISHPVNSHSFVISACTARPLTKPCSGISSSEQNPAPPERRSTNESPPPMPTDLRLLVDHDLRLPSEPELIETHMRIASKEAAVMKCVESSCQNVDDKDEPQKAEKNVDQLSDDASLNASSTRNISNLPTRDAAVAVNNNEDHSRPISHETVVTAAAASHELSDQSRHLADDSSILSVEPNFAAELSVKACDSQLQCSSISPVNYVDADDCKTTEELFILKSDHDCPVEVEEAKLKSGTQQAESALQVTILTAGSVPQQPSEHSLQSMHIALPSILSNETQREGLQLNLCNDKLQHSSSTNQLPGDRSPNASSTGRISNLRTQDAVVDSNEEHPLSVSQYTVPAAAPVQQERLERQLTLSSYPFILHMSVEPNLVELSVEDSDSQLQCKSIGPVNYVEVTDCKTADELLFFTKCDRERSVEAEVTEMENDALETYTTRRGQRTKTSKKVSRNKSAQIFGTVSLNVGVESRLRSFDEVSIELPCIVWSRLQSEEIVQPEVMRLCQSAFEALVLRSAVIQPSQPPSRRPVEHRRPSKRSKLPSRLLATAQTRRHTVESSAKLSINVVRSRVDEAVQSADTAFQLSPSNCFSRITNEDATTRTAVATNTRSDYISAKRYLDQLAIDLTSTNQTKKLDAARPSGFEQNKRQPRNLHQLKDLPKTDESTDNNEQEYKEQDRRYVAEEEARRQTVLVLSTLAPEVTSETNQTEVKYNERPCLRLLCSKFGSSVAEKDEATQEDADDDPVTRRNSNSDDVVSSEALPVLATAEKRRAGGEPCWQPTVDYELNDTQPSLSSSGNACHPRRNFC